MSAERLEWIDSRKESLLDTLMQLSAINSGTGNLSGLHDTQNALHSLFSPLADEIKIDDSVSVERTDHLGITADQHYGKIISFSKPILERLRGCNGSYISGHLIFFQFLYSFIDVNDACFNI